MDVSSHDIYIVPQFIDVTGSYHNNFRLSETALDFYRSFGLMDGLVDVIVPNRV